MPGSVIVNGVAYPAYDPEAGFALNDIPAGGNASVEYSHPFGESENPEFRHRNGSLTYTADGPVCGPVTYT